MIVGRQDFPSSVPWQDKWIHFPDRADMPLAVMISGHDAQDDGSDGSEHGPRGSTSRRARRERRRTPAVAAWLTRIHLIGEKEQ